MLKNSKARTFAPIPVETEKVGKLVLDGAYRVHTALGPGLLESVYESCLAFEIRQSGSLVETQVPFPIVYRDLTIESGLRLDLLVDKCVIVEVKSVDNFSPIYEAQLLTYLRLTKVRLGFLINFNVLRLKEGIRRLVV